MFVLDTNVISELRRPERAHSGVLAWASASSLSDFYLSAITLLELEIGALSIARKDGPQGVLFRIWIDRIVVPQFDGRILPVDADVARRCAPSRVPDRRSDRDALIAATALVHGFAVVTRNVADFAPTGVRVVNPWAPPPA